MAENEDIKSGEMTDDNENVAKKKPSKKKPEEGSVNNKIEMHPKLEEVVSRTVVFSFGRMNPVTVGHEKLVNKVLLEAKKNNATPVVYLSHSQDPKKNPLSYKDKARIAQKAFGKIVKVSNAKTIIQVMQELNKSFNKAILIVGADRVKEFETLLSRYNGKDYNFDNIDVMSAGDRDPDAEGVEGMSASKMRAAAASGDQESFVLGLPKKIQRDGADIYDMVRAGMNLAEELEMHGLLDEAALNFAQRRKRAITMRKYKNKIAIARKRMMKRVASPDKIKTRARKKAIAIVKAKVAGKKGADYGSLSAAEKQMIDKKIEKRKALIQRIAKRLVPQVRRDDRARLSARNKSKSEEFLDINSILSLIEEVSDDINKSLTIDESKAKDGLNYKAEKSRIPLSIIEEVYARGTSSWVEDAEMNPQQFGYARVNSFISGGSTRRNADADLWEKVCASEEFGAGFEGTDALVQNYKEATPGETGKKTKPKISDWSPLIKDKSSKVVNEEFESIFEDMGTPKHHLGIGTSFKHMKKHAMMHIDYDMDGDVDQDDFKKSVPDEMTGAEKKDLTKAAFQKYAREKQHTKKGVAFEDASKSFEIFTLDEQFELEFLSEAAIIDKAIAAIHKYVMGGTELGDIAYQVSRASGVNMSGRELEKKYIEKYGKPKTSRLDPKAASALKRKYGFSTEDNSNQSINEEFESLMEAECQLIGMKQIKEFEKVVDGLFKKFGIDFNFTRHFGDRMSDERNSPCISLKELAEFIKKIYAKQGKSLKGIAGAEAVIKDMQTDLNIPVAVTYDSKNDEFDVVMKTIMRKKNFKTPNQIIKY